MLRDVANKLQIDRQGAPISESGGHREGRAPVGRIDAVDVGHETQPRVRHVSEPIEEAELRRAGWLYEHHGRFPCLSAAAEASAARAAGSAAPVGRAPACSPAAHAAPGRTGARLRFATVAAAPGWIVGRRGERAARARTARTAGEDGGGADASE